MRRHLLPVVLLSVAALAATPAVAQVGGKNKIRYDTFEWKVYETPHFHISYYDRSEPSLDKVASYAESSYDELARRLNHQVRQPIPLLAYATHAEFEQTNVIVNFIPEGAGAFATPIRNRMVLPLDLPDRELQALIQHELTHVFQYDILFQGRRGRAIYSRPPTWVMEGMASYLGDDEGSRDGAYIRDAAFANLVPSVASNIQGFIAYRFGHMVFEYIEDEWGEDGVRDFVFAFRGGLGGRINRPFRKVFNLDAEEFDSRFRTWLRRHYQEHSHRGMPEEFGRRFRVDRFTQSQEVSPVATPSGDLIAAFSTYKSDLDVVLLGVPDRRLYKNLTKGWTNKYLYLVAQELTVAGHRGRDLAISPDGNLVAVFGRTERTRTLFLLDALKGGIDRAIEIPLPVERTLEPAFSPDGSTVAFHAFKRGQSDIYLLDLASEQITNLTNDEAYDSAPVFTPDGSAIVYTTQVGEVGKLARISVRDPGQRQQLTFGAGNDEGAAFSADGKRLYFASDRDAGILNIYQLDLESNRLVRVTNVFGMAINPVPVSTLEGERVVFQAYARGRWDLYIADPNQGEVIGTEAPAELGIDLEPYVPAMTITIDPSKVKEKKKRRFFFEDARTYVGIDQDQYFISDTYVALSDNYGDRRILISLQSVSSYTNLYAAYMNLEPRLQWGVSVFDRRLFYVWDFDPYEERFDERERVYRQTGAAFLAQYPLSTYYRLEGQAGFATRKIDYLSVNPATGEVSTIEFSHDIPFVSVGVTGDTARYRSWGPHGGSRWNLTLYYGHDLDEGKALSKEVRFEGRKYVPTTARTELAARIYLAHASGTMPNVSIFGGTDTLRGVNVRSMSGNRAAYLNLEWRFPVIDRLDSPILQLRDVRGHLFLDVGAAWYDVDGLRYSSYGRPGYTFMEDGRLVDGLSSYGFGFSLNLMGIPMHFEYLKFWDFKDSIEGTDEVEFWVGYKF